MKEVNKKQDGRIALRCAVLTSPDILPQKAMREKAKKLADLEDLIIKLIANMPISFQTYDMLVKNKENLISIYLDAPLFYRENVDVLFYYVDATNTAYFHPRELGKAANVNNGFSLMLNIFSDLETKGAYEKLVKDHPKRHFYSDIETTYFFDKQGNIAKTVRLPEEIRTSRKRLLSQLEPIYQSTMTAEDFSYAERALIVIKNRIEDYLKWSKQPQDATV